MTNGEETHGPEVPSCTNVYRTDPHGTSECFRRSSARSRVPDDVEMGWHSSDMMGEVMEKGEHRPNNGAGHRVYMNDESATGLDHARSW